jgi:hypothetical protein
MQHTNSIYCILLHEEQFADAEGGPMADLAGLLLTFLVTPNPLGIFRDRCRSTDDSLTAGAR